MAKKKGKKRTKKGQPNRVAPSLSIKLEDKIRQLASLEKEYQSIIKDKLEELRKNSKVKLQERGILSHIVACTNGIFIQRKIEKHLQTQVLASSFAGSIDSFRSSWKFKKLEHFKLANKIQFLTIELITYDQINTYNIKLKASEDFQTLISKDNLIEDGFIRSVSDAIETVTHGNFERGQLIFRGQTNEEWFLLPKLFREGYDRAKSIEAALFERLITGHKSPYSYSFDPVEHLMNLQHFGIPTRLLDWTSDILVALFFACYDENNCFCDKHGKLFLIDRFYYPKFDINSRKNRIFKQPINDNTKEQFINRLIIDKLYILEPIIKNPRLRIQNGCFLFFTFLPLQKHQKEFVTLEKFIDARNKYDQQENKNNEKKAPLWIAHKKIDKDYKRSILKELDEQHGISEKTLFAETPHIENALNYYKNLYEKALKKASWIREQRKRK